MQFQSNQSPRDCHSCEFRSLRMFCDLSEEALRDFQSIGMQMRLPRGAVLFQEGDPPSSIAVLCEGQVKLQSTSREGKILILKIAGPGDVLGFGAVISGNCYEVTAEVLEPTIVKSIRKDEFRSFLERHKQLSVHAARVLSEEYKSAFFDTPQLVASHSVAARLASILLDLSRNASDIGGRRHFTMALTHEELANLARTSRETITRILGRFRRQRWVHVQGSSMTILDPERLTRIASQPHVIAVTASNDDYC